MATLEQLGVRERVTFVPWLDDVREIYAATDVNANCSTREPFGRAAVEAAACGVPTVCFDDSGAAETGVDGVTACTIAAGAAADIAEQTSVVIRRSAA
jgi:glycosyltransferase involved in cell wall biosynthesis